MSVRPGHHRRALDLGGSCVHVARMLLQPSYFKRCFTILPIAPPLDFDDEVINRKQALWHGY